MRKFSFFACAALTLLCTTSAFAQSSDEKKMSVGVEAVPVLPIGNLSDVSAFGLGALGAFDYWVTPQVRITGRAGYIYHFTKGEGFSFSAIPIWGGARYHFEEKGGPWIGGELGPNVLLASFDTGPLGSVSDNEVKFGIGVGGGYKLNEWDFGGRLFAYDIGHFGDTFAISAMVGYHFAEF